MGGCDKNRRHRAMFGTLSETECVGKIYDVAR
jgi:hypothetical protein